MFCFCSGIQGQCFFDIVRIENTKNGIEVTVNVFQGCKGPKIVIKNCSSKNISLELPSDFRGPDLFTIPLNGINCDCETQIEYEISSTSPYCSASKKLDKEYCDTYKVKEPAPPPPPVPPVIIRDTITIDKVIYKLPPCKTCYKFSECFNDCFLCCLLGFLLGLYFLIRILLIGANSKLEIPLIGTIIWSHFWEFLYGSFALAFIASCPCQSALFGIIGIIISAGLIIFDLFREEKKYTEWKSGLLIGGGALIAFISIIILNCN